MDPGASGPNATGERRATSAGASRLRRRAPAIAGQRRSDGPRPVGQVSAAVPKSGGTADGPDLSSWQDEGRFRFSGGSVARCPPSTRSASARSSASRASADTIRLRAAAMPISRPRSAPSCASTTATTPAYLLESVEGGERLGRYSFLGIGPRRLLEVRDGERGSRTGRSASSTTRPTCRSTTSRPPTRWPRCATFVPRRRVEPSEGMPRFTGGAVGALAYDAVSVFEPTVPLPAADPVGVPLASFIETDLVLVFDHLTHTLAAIASLHTDAPRPGGALPHRRAGALRGARADRPPERGRDGRSRLRSAGPAAGCRRRATTSVSCPSRSQTSAWAGTRTRPRSRNAKDAIAAGEAIQVVLARRQTLALPVRADGAVARRHRPLPRAAPRQPQPLPLLRPDARRSRWSAPARSCSSRSRATG